MLPAEFSESKYDQWENSWFIEFSVSFISWRHGRECKGYLLCRAHCWKVRLDRCKFAKNNYSLRERSRHSLIHQPLKAEAWEVQRHFLYWCFLSNFRDFANKYLCFSSLLLICVLSVWKGCGWKVEYEKKKLANILLVEAGSSTPPPPLFQILRLLYLLANTKLCNKKMSPLHRVSFSTKQGRQISSIVQSRRRCSDKNKGENEPSAHRWVQHCSNSTGKHSGCIANLPHKEMITNSSRTNTSPEDQTPFSLTFQRTKTRQHLDLTMMLFPNPVIALILKWTTLP